MQLEVDQLREIGAHHPFANHRFQGTKPGFSDESRRISQSLKELNDHMRVINSEIKNG